MGKDKRRQERSRTPEVRWELLPPAPDPTILPEKSKSRRDDDAAGKANVRREVATKSRAEQLAEQAWAEKAKADASAAAAAAVSNGAAAAEEARLLEKEAWRNVVILLAALRGDPKIDALIKDKYADFATVARNCGAGGPPRLTLDEAKDGLKGWFEKCLRGGNRHGPAARTGLLDKLADSLKERVDSLRNTEISRAARVLEDGPEHEEGPLICTLLSRELEGSRFDGLWIARESKGIYRIGDDHEGSNLPSVDQEGARIYRPKVVVKVAKSQLLIDGFYHEGETVLNPAKVPIGVFLGVYFEGLSLKEATNRWRMDTAEAKAPQRPAGLDGRGLEASRSRSPPPAIQQASRAAQEDGSLRALVETLPPGWELRESRSKKGVFYYAHAATGRSQLERPKA